MRNSAEILEEARVNIAHIHTRPSMHVPVGKSNCADSLDTLLWHSYYFWAFIQNREAEFRNTADAVRERRKCRCLGFADAFRLRHPELGESQVFDEVLEAWSEVAALLRVPIEPS